MKINETFFFLIFIIILLLFGFYYLNESDKRLYKGDVISKQLTISSFEPTITDYEETNDIRFEFSEYPNKRFKIDYLNIDVVKGLKLVSSVEINKQITIDVERLYFQKKIKQNSILGIKPEINILGARISNDEEIPITDYNSNLIRLNSATSALSFLIAFIILLVWIYDYFKSKRKLKH